MMLKFSCALGLLLMTGTVACATDATPEDEEMGETDSALAAGHKERVASPAPRVSATAADRALCTRGGEYWAKKAGYGDLLKAEVLYVSADGDIRCKYTFLQVNPSNSEELIATQMESTLNRSLSP